MRGNRDLAQVAVGVEVAVTARGPFIDGSTDSRGCDCRILTSKPGLDHSFGSLEQVENGEAVVWLASHMSKLPVASENDSAISVQWVNNIAVERIFRLSAW